jgi:hypothetical protein
MANARIVSDLANTLAAIPPDALVANVGVRLGEWIEMLLMQPAVAKLLAMDHFNLHIRQPDMGSSLGDQQHFDFVQARFLDAVRSRKLEIRYGRLDAIKALPPSSTHAFFIRGCFEFQSLTDELYMCDAKLRPHGLIWVADYIMADYTSGQKYDVVRAVNEFVIKCAYNLAYLVLDHAMFCTVVLQRSR